MKIEGIEGKERIGNYKRLVVGGSVKNPRKSREPSPLPLFRTFKISAKNWDNPKIQQKTVLISPCDGTNTTIRHSLGPTRASLDAKNHCGSETLSFSLTRPCADLRSYCTMYTSYCKTHLNLFSTVLRNELRTSSADHFLNQFLCQSDETEVECSARFTAALVGVRGGINSA